MYNTSVPKCEVYIGVLAISHLKTCRLLIEVDRSRNFDKVGHALPGLLKEIEQQDCFLCVGVFMSMGNGQKLNNVGDMPVSYPLILSITM
jgi:hypothetical protein